MWIGKVKVQKIAANSQTYIACLQIKSFIDSLNLLRILLSFIVHVGCRVNKKFRDTTKFLNLFPDQKRCKYICMKYIYITKYIHCFPINKYTEGFLITKLTTDLWSKPYSALDISLGLYLFFDSEPYLGISNECNDQGIKVQVKKTFKSYSFLSHTHPHTHTHTHTHTYTHTPEY